MKVLFISSGNNQYGIAPFIKSQGESLIKTGVELEYFTIKGKGIGGYAKAILNLRRQLKKKKVALIHAHFGLCGWVAQLARRREKLVVSFMGDDIVGSNHHGGGIKPFSRFIAKINVFLAKRFYDYIIVKSEEMLDKCATISSRFQVIPNGVDLDRFFPVAQKEAKMKLGLSLSNKYLIFVADPARIEKNFCLAEAAFIISEIPDTILLQIYAKSVEDLPLYYNAADLLLLTSFHEGSPNVIKEAMACNCPIVATDVGDVRWVLGETKGCFIARHNPGEVAEKLRSAIDFGKRTNGRQRIIDLGLDNVTVANKIVQIYNRVVNNNI